MRRLHLPEFIEILVPTRDRNAFRKEGETLLAEMGKALNQESVAYETREGLTILTL